MSNEHEEPKTETAYKPLTVAQIHYIKEQLLDTIPVINTDEPKSKDTALAGADPQPLTVAQVHYIHEQLLATIPVINADEKKKGEDTELHA